MASHPINDNFLVRWVIILIYKLISIPFVFRFLNSSGSVIFLSSRVCIKATPFTSLAEASTMRFVAENTTIPVPRVYCAFEHKGLVYIVMERMDGLYLGDGWRHRTPESRAYILNTIRDMVQQLHQIPAPIGCGVSNVDGGPIYDPRLPAPKHWGPFRTIDDFHRKLRADLDGYTDRFPELNHLISFHKQQWRTPVFTHGDLSSLNILARGDEVVGIVDWETSGWMPPYWEYTSAWNVNPQNQFWQDEVDRFLEPAPEALAAEAIRRKYNGDY